MRPLECTQGFSKIRPSDLVFDLTRPIFKLVRNIIQANILMGSFMSIGLKMWPLEHTQGFSKI